MFGIDPALERSEIAERAIAETAEFFTSMGIPMHLREVGIDESRIPEMAHHIMTDKDLTKAYAPLTEQDIVEILTASL